LPLSRSPRFDWTSELPQLRPLEIARGEPAMDDVAEKIIAILRKNMRNPEKEITLNTKLTDLEIESLDLAVIVFDIEDTFCIQIPYNANEEVVDFATVGSVVDRVKAVLTQQNASNAAA
jgi:acyl carrier protein